MPRVLRHFIWLAVPRDDLDWFFDQRQAHLSLYSHIKKMWRYVGHKITMSVILWSNISGPKYRISTLIHKRLIYRYIIASDPLPYSWALSYSLSISPLITLPLFLFLLCPFIFFLLHFFKIFFLFPFSSSPSATAGRTFPFTPPFLWTTLLIRFAFN